VDIVSVFVSIFIFLLINVMCCR